MAVVITILQGKGGVGKTTTTHALAQEAVARGKRVLVVDADSQMNISQLLLAPHLPVEYEGDYIQFIEDKGLISLAAHVDRLRHATSEKITPVHFSFPFLLLLFPHFLRQPEPLRRERSPFAHGGRYDDIFD
jgi:cellulose biosynthesis protein BcsQ